MKKNEIALFIGRFQPPHKGHFAIVRKLLKEGKKVVIGIRDTSRSKKNPLDYTERYFKFVHKFNEQVVNGMVEIFKLQDIDEVVYGRDVGYKLREIRLSKRLEKISGTKIRNGKDKNKFRFW